tara:strand:+ start:24 stop:167 length:144 start_codon:yes stop_codon:yes gene_type:complete
MSKDKKILNKVKEWLNDNIQANLQKDLIEDNQHLLEFIKEQELKEEE